MKVDTLKSQTLLYLIGHLEEFPLSIFIHLPTILRREFLINLPAADIYQFETVPGFTSGINIDEIWRETYCSRSPLFSPKIDVASKSSLSHSPCYVIVGNDDTGEPLMASKFQEFYADPYIPGGLSPPSKPNLSWKEKYLGWLLEIVLSRYFELDESCAIKVLSGFFIITPTFPHNSSDMTMYNINRLYNIEGCVLYCPNRYVKYFSLEGFNDHHTMLVKTMSCLIKHFDFRPRCLHCNFFPVYSPTEDSNVLKANSMILTDFLRGLQMLHVTRSMRDTPHTSGIPKFENRLDFDAIFSNIASPLKSFHIKPFALTAFDYDKLVLSKLNPMCLNCLTELSLSVTDHQIQNVWAILNKCINTLEEVSLHCDTKGNISSILISVLSSLFMKSQFHRLMLTNFNMSSEDFVLFMDTFFHSSGIKEKHLLLGGTKVLPKENEGIDLPGCIASSVSVPNNLTLSACLIDEEVIRQLLSKQGVVQLCRVLFKPGTQHGGEYMFFTNQNVCIEHLQISIMPVASSVKHLGNILINNCIKNISLILFGFLSFHPAVKPNIAELHQALSQSCGSLINLRFVSDIGNITNDEQKSLFTAILSLEQNLSKLNLVLYSTSRGLKIKKNLQGFATVFQTTYLESQCKFKLRKITLSINEELNPSSPYVGLTTQDIDLLQFISEEVVIKQSNCFNNWFE